MKKLFISMLAVAALASCSQEDVIVADKGELIGFNSFVENATRAAEDPSYNATSFTSFNVWGTVGGVPIYSGEAVTKGNDNIWKCASNKQYWIDGASYEFAAVAGVADTAVTPGTDKLPSKVTVDATTAKVDLLYAEKVERVGGDDKGAVELNFKHLLSKVKFTVNNSSISAENYSFEVRNLKVNGAYKGDITLESKEWNTTGNKDYSVPTISVNADEKNGTNTAECATELLLIPGDIKISFTVAILCNGTEIASHNYPATPATSYNKTIVGGNAYNFIIGVSVGEEITFTAQQTDWDYDINDDNKVDANDNITLQ